MDNIKNDIKNLDDSIKKLEQTICLKFSELEKQINELKLDNKKLNDVNIICNKMSEHINFVEDTYSSLKAPINFVKKSIEKITGNTATDLPSIKQ
jgi:hypothetical protein